MLQLFETPIKRVRPIAPPVGKSAPGQCMTPSNIAVFMASLLSNASDGFHLLDAGAGEGSLTCTFFDALCNADSPLPYGEVSLFECDAAMVHKLEVNTARSLGVLSVKRHLHHIDFIEHAAVLVLRKQRPFFHAILNPPYKKISSSSLHRTILRDVGIETVNLYTAFVALAVSLLQAGGTLVAIIPRSFCNGPYYRPFREFILRHVAIRHIHLFTSRTEAFKTDKVLQENVIILLERDAEQADIVSPGDPEKFIHIPDAQDTTESLSLANTPLPSLGIEVSTGPVVDFRLKEYLRDMPKAMMRPCCQSPNSPTLPMECWAAWA